MTLHDLEQTQYCKDNAYTSELKYLTVKNLFIGFILGLIVLTTLLRIFVEPDPVVRPKTPLTLELEKLRREAESPMERGVSEALRTPVENEPVVANMFTKDINGDTPSDIFTKIRIALNTANREMLHEAMHAESMVLNTYTESAVDMNRYSSYLKEDILKTNSGHTWNTWYSERFETTLFLWGFAEGAMALPYAGAKKSSKTFYVENYRELKRDSTMYNQYVYIYDVTAPNIYILGRVDGAWRVIHYLVNGDKRDNEMKNRCSKHLPNAKLDRSNPDCYLFHFEAYAVRKLNPEARTALLAMYRDTVNRFAKSAHRMIVSNVKDGTLPPPSVTTSLNRAILKKYMHVTDISVDVLLPR